MKQKMYKGRYFLDKIDDTVYSTDSYALWILYRWMFYRRPYPGEISGFVSGPAPDWDVITSNGKVLMRKINGKWIKEAF